MPAEKDPFEFESEDESCKTVGQKIEVIRILLDSSSHGYIWLRRDWGKFRWGGSPVDPKPMQPSSPLRRPMTLWRPPLAPWRRRRRGGAWTFFRGWRSVMRGRWRPGSCRVWKLEGRSIQRPEGGSLSLLSQPNQTPSRRPTALRRWRTSWCSSTRERRRSTTIFPMRR